MLHLESQSVDAVAADVVYHRSCYKHYTNPTVLKQFRDLPEELGCCYTNAYSILFEEMESSVLAGTKVVFMPDLRGRFTSLLAEQGVHNLQYRTEKVKRHLRHQFGDRLEFYQPESRATPCMAYAAHLPAAKIAELLQDEQKSQGGILTLSDEDTSEAAHNEADFWNSSSSHMDDTNGSTVAQSNFGDPVSDVYHAALYLRHEVLAMATPPLPSSTGDLFTRTTEVPNLLYNFLVWLLHSDFSTTSISEHKVSGVPPEVHCGFSQ